MSDETPPSAAVVVRWGDDIIDALDEPSRYHAEIAALPAAIANVICVELLDWQVRNGGFHQYFFNSYGITINGAIRGFEAMGLPQCAEIARAARDRFGQSFPEDRGDRIGWVGDVGHRKTMNFDELDGAYYALDRKEIYAVLDLYATAAMKGRLQ
ncbi:DMP19 family protein [Kumtagia ephedrae]|uniref:DNA mimic protein DMP19 C-terminal domain-containing protein n=1 Tax=Kumtagia ephedrae TaxID=2116701 RepID=A0A2P7SCC6_9HYPH|nr:DUF4375 domain-containing protein [Mesorhizobium ephedrae]PSJ60118.1 hypothetical protein C7I84_12575 [Mesorhizobium ephedrae]